jgi:uncharacterized protein with GYD domain
MATFMLQLSYAPATVAAMVKKPTNRTEVIKVLVGKFGAKLVGSWMSFGDYDAVLIIEGADAVGVASCAMAVTASGAFTKFKTTPLLTTDEALSAMKQAATLGYAPPGK